MHAVHIKIKTKQSVQYPKGPCPCALILVSYDHARVVLHIKIKIKRL
jgi:hypothetical protein